MPCETANDIIILTLFTEMLLATRRLLQHAAVARGLDRHDALERPFREEERPTGKADRSCQQGQTMSSQIGVRCDIS
jgi:hypothetical protein